MTWGVGVLGLQLLLELTVKDLIVLIFGLLLGVEFQSFFEAFMNQETFVQHLKIESCHVQLTSLADAIEAILPKALVESGHLASGHVEWLPGSCQGTT